MLICGHFIPTPSAVTTPACCKSPSSFVLQVKGNEREDAGAVTTTSSRELVRQQPLPVTDASDSGAVAAQSCPLGLEGLYAGATTTTTVATTAACAEAENGSAARETQDGVKDEPAAEAVEERVEGRSLPEALELAFDEEPDQASVRPCKFWFDEPATPARVFRSYRDRVSFRQRASLDCGRRKDRTPCSTVAGEAAARLNHGRQ